MTFPGKLIESGQNWDKKWKFQENLPKIFIFLSLKPINWGKINKTGYNIIIWGKINNVSKIQTYRPIFGPTGIFRKWEKLSKNSFLLIS